MDRTIPICVLRYVLLTLLALSFRVVAQPEIPNTPVGRAFLDWLTSFNSADPRQIATFKQKYARKGDVAETLEFRRYTGGFDLLQIERSTPHSLLVLMKERGSERGVHLEANVKDDGRGDNLTMDISFATLPPQFAPARRSMPDALAELKKRVAQRTASERFSGALLMSKGDQMLLRQAWGYANRASLQVATVDMQFRIGSMTS